ncbi:MAG: ABC transporter ATP-binding protein [Streptosporangiales bacterium]
MALSGRLGGALVRLIGPRLPPDALRSAGTTVLRQSLARHRGLAVTLAVVTAVGIGTTLLLPGALAQAIDAVGSRQEFPTALGELIALLVIATVLDAVDDLASDYYGSYLTAGFRRGLLGRAMALGVPGQRRFPPGDLLSRLTINAGAPAGFVPVLMSAIATLLVSVGAVVALALIQVWLAATFLVGVPVAIALLRLLVARAAEPFTRYQELLAGVITRLLDAVRGARTIRASGTADREAERILKPLPELNAIGRRGWAVQRMASWQMTLLVPMLQVLVLSVAGVLVAAQQVTAGEFVAAASYVVLALRSVGLVDTVTSLISCQVGAGRVGEVLQATPAAPQPESPLPVPAGAGRLELSGITVRYDDRVVLDDLDLVVPAGASVAVVGRSGTGKSVLVSLIGRLLDPGSGVVSLDGCPVDRMDLTALRRTVTYAFEVPALLGSTVHDMIAYGRPEASRVAVEAAAAAAQADAFIRLLPDGYDTPLDRAPMSGGELQRLGLARAVLAEARVIVLDDATSSLDTATEVRVAQTLGRLLAQRTAVIVAYRTSTAARADLVAWLDGGRIRALAPHADLWHDPGYRAVFAAAPDGAEVAPYSIDAGVAR